MGHGVWDGRGVALGSVVGGRGLGACVTAGVQVGGAVGGGSVGGKGLASCVAAGVSVGGAVGGRSVGGKGLASCAAPGVQVGGVQLGGMVAVQAVVAALIGTAVAIKVGAAALGVHAVSQGKRRERTKMVRGKTVGQQGVFLVVDDLLSTSTPSCDNLFIVLGPCLTN